MLFNVGDIVQVIENSDKFPSSGLVGIVESNSGGEFHVGVFFPRWDLGHNSMSSRFELSAPRSHYWVEVEKLRLATPEEVALFNETNGELIKSLLKQNRILIRICPVCKGGRVRKNKTFFCPRCIEKTKLSRGANYAKIPAKRDGRVVKSQRFIGVEIEAERIGSSEVLPLLDIDPSVGIGGDGSLKNGIELRLPPRQKIVFENMVTKTCKITRAANYSIERTCGLHVHIDMSKEWDDHDVEKLKQVYETYYALEDTIYHSLPYDRRQNPYSSFLSVSNLFSALRNCSSRETISNFACRRSINLYQLKAFKTIEFRSHEGTLDEKEIINWSALLTQIVDYATDGFNRKDVIRIFDYAPGSLGRMTAALKIIGASDRVKDYVETRTRLYPRRGGDDFRTYSDMTRVIY